MSDTTVDERAGGRRFGRYRVISELGVGGMGEVLLADDELLGREVAIKTLRPQLAAALKGTLQDERLFREARAIAVLGHPNIVRIFDMGVEDGIPYLVMEAVRGPTLKQKLEKDALPKSELSALGIQMARALDAAHGKGILHRDIKPSNILEAEAMVWKLADFGIAHTPDSSLTITGQFLGTPMYAAPESMMAGEFSPASDVYGLAATLYEAACGQTVVGPGSPSSLAERLTRGVTPPSQVRPGVPRELERAILAGLSLEIPARPSAAELADMLARGTARRATRQRSSAAAAPRRPRRALAAAGVLVVAAAIAGAFALGRSNADRTAPAAPPPSPPVETATHAAVPTEPAPVHQVEEPPPPEPAAEEPASTEEPPVTEEPAAAVDKKAAPAPTTARAPVPGIDEAKKLIAAGHRGAAIDRLQALRTRYPKNAEVPYLLGNLYFEKQWWEHGFANYKLAIENDRAYREDPTLIKHAIQNLMSPSQNWRGVRFLTHDIGAPAIPHLETAVKSGPGYIRKRARVVLDKLRRHR